MVLRGRTLALWTPFDLGARARVVTWEAKLGSWMASGSAIEMMLLFCFISIHGDGIVGVWHYQRVGDCYSRRGSRPSVQSDCPVETERTRMSGHDGRV